MIGTTHGEGGSGQPRHTFLILPRVPLRYPPLFALLSSIALLTACGSGGSNSTSTATGPTALDTQYAESAGLTATLDLATSLVTLKWNDTFPDASRYQIEQQNADGSWSAFDAVWATQGSGLGLQWTGPVGSATTLRVTAVVSGYTVPLDTNAWLSAASAAAGQQIEVTPPAQLPAIAIDQSEPVQDTLGVSIVNGGTYQDVDYAVDQPGATALADTGAPYSASLDMSGVTTGTHILFAQLLVTSTLTLLLTRTVQVHTPDAAVSLNVVSEPSTVDTYVTATSDSNIVSVTATINSEISLGSLTAPNACNPAPCPAGQPFNAYLFSFGTQTVGIDYQSIQVKATDGAGHTASSYAVVILPSPATATLNSPVDGASVQGTVAISGTFASGTPGALELMVTLSGNPVYDTTVANPGTAVPFATNISLAGVSNGIHTVDVYARVGNTSYAWVAGAFVMVTGAQ
jgi:hypothetical protein